MTRKNEKTYFTSDITNRERACFEIGIKLGALYHILSGIPVSSNPEIIEDIERGIEASISCQPFVKSIKINLNRDEITGDKSSEFKYDEISGKMITAKVIIEYESIEVIAKVEWIEDLQYPLMYIEKIAKKE